MNCNGCNQNRALSLCLGAAAVFAAAAAWGANFAAEDSSWDGVYSNAETWVGLNGGANFTAWEVRQGDAANVVDDFSDEAHNEGDFTLSSKDGSEVGVARDTAQALTSGTLQIDVWHGTWMDDFRGVAVYGTEQNELLRWGVRIDGFYYSLDGGSSYDLIPDGNFKPAPTVTVTYMLTWSRMDGGLQFELAGQYGGDLDWSPFTVPTLVAGTQAVGGMGVLVSGTKKDEGKEMAGMGFDNVSVTGEAVPEPGTVGLLLAGAAAMAGLRRRRVGRE